MNKIKKITWLLIAVTLCSVLFSSSAFAYIPYTGYNFDFYGEIVQGPSGYVPEDVLYGKDVGIDEFVNPCDMFITKDEKIFVVDSGGANMTTRIIVMNKNFKLIKMIENFYLNGKKISLINAAGICVDDNGAIYLCDPDNKRVIKFDMNGVISLVYGEPPEEYKSEAFTYQPQKLGIGINGSIFVISKGCTDGIMEFDTKGTFVRFFGAPEVELSVNDYLNIYWRNIYRVFAGDAADVYFATYVPSEFVNLSVDDNGFVYTMVAANEKSTDEMYKLNFQGTNILDPSQKSTSKKTAALSANYGDLITRATVGKGNVFADVCLDEEGFFTLLDSNLGRLFEYDKEGNLIFVYANKGNSVNQVQKGLLVSPSAAIKVDNKTVVIDAETGTITIFKLSEFGEQLHEAVGLYNQGKYDQAETPWKNVLKSDANSELAHIGLGKVHYLRGNYKEALDEFKLGNDRVNYSRTFKLYRDEVIRSNFTWIITGLVVLLILFIVWKKFGSNSIAKFKKKDGSDQ